MKSDKVTAEFAAAAAAAARNKPDEGSWPGYLFNLVIMACVAYLIYEYNTVY